MFIMQRLLNYICRLLWLSSNTVFLLEPYNIRQESLAICVWKGADRGHNGWSMLEGTMAVLGAGLSHERWKG